MRKPLMPLAVGLFLVLVPSFAYALPGESDITPLSNRDVLMMVSKHLSEEAIVNVIKSSPCTFDTFPPVLQDMKRRGVPDAVLQAMVDAPYGPSLQTRATSNDELGEQPIYHYTDQLRALGYLPPSTNKRPSRYSRPNDRMRATSNRQRR